MNKEQPELKKILHFLKTIAIEVIEKDLTEATFLPGLSLGPNAIYVDYSRLQYPGDLLHEAGHIAVTEPSKRKLIGTDKMDANWPTQGDEIAAILWSYAALSHLGLPSEFVFHNNGYKDSSQWFIENFTSGNFIGLPLLQWFKMASTDEEISKHAHPPFPAMLNWLRSD